MVAVMSGDISCTGIIQRTRAQQQDRATNRSEGKLIFGDWDVTILKPQAAWKWSQYTEGCLKQWGQAGTEGTQRRLALLEQQPRNSSQGCWTKYRLSSWIIILLLIHEKIRLSIPFLLVVLFKKHLDMETNDSVHLFQRDCLHSILDLNPLLTMLKNTDCYFISNSRFSVRLNLIMINCTFKRLKDVEGREKGSAFPRDCREAKETANRA